MAWGGAELYVLGRNMWGRNCSGVYSEIWERSGVQREECALISRENEMDRYLKCKETQRWRKIFET
jgi:hypothetical protein